MAKSSFEIRMEYNRAVTQANSLEQMRNSAENDLRDCMSEIAGNWTGENARAYLQKVEKLSDSVRKTAERLKDTAEAIRKIARNTYNAEMQALELARI